MKPKPVLEQRLIKATRLVMPLKPAQGMVPIFMVKPLQLVPVKRLIYPDEKAG